MSRSGRASRSNRALNSAATESLGTDLGARVALGWDWTAVILVMSLLASRCHRIHPAPRKPLARTIKGVPRRGIITEFPKVQINFECGQLPTQKVQPNSHVHVMHPEIARGRCKNLAIDLADHGVTASDRSGGQVSGGHAATRPDSASNVSLAVLASLRIWKACTIRIKPRITSDTTETIVSTTMESNGQTSTTPPAIMDRMPNTTYQPRPGKSRSLSATAISETPKKMKPAPIHSDSSRTA